MGLLNSAHECVRPSLLDFLFSDTPLPAAIVIIYGLPPLPPTSGFVSMCYCVCVFGFMRLWVCGGVSLWVCGLVFCGFVGLFVLVC